MGDYLDRRVAAGKRSEVAAGLRLGHRAARHGSGIRRGRLSDRPVATPRFGPSRQEVITISQRKLRRRERQASAERASVKT